MPSYQFECQECNVRFTRSLKIGDHPTHPCPSCKDEAPRLWEGAGFSHKFEAGKAPVGNTGVHKEDYPSADHAVGRSAESRWQTYEERAEVKKAVRGDGKTHALIRHDGDGFTDYEPMRADGLEARRKLARDLYARARVNSNPGTTTH